MNKRSPAGAMICVVTARISSKRLPGKVLLPMLGRPMLSHLIERLQSVPSLDCIVIATSTNASDDAVAEFASASSVDVWRGDLDDVLGRIAGAAAAKQAAAVVRVTGDSPLLDPGVVQRAIDLFARSSADLVTNVFPRSFPKGQSVEILTRDTLARLASEATDPQDREHPTRYAYAHPDQFTIINFRHDPPRAELQLSVDSPDDFARAEMLLDRSRSAGGFASVAALIRHADELDAVIT